MSFNRLKYDTCAYKHEISESVGTLDWILDNNRFENCGKCRFEFGLVGGTNVSHAKGNLVDVESDLMGTTRLQTNCPTLKYINPCPNGDMNNCQPSQIVIQPNPGNSGRVIDTNMQHLQPCQMVRYKPVPLPEPISYTPCNFTPNQS